VRPLGFLLAVCIGFIVVSCGRDWHSHRRSARLGLRTLKPLRMGTSVQGPPKGPYCTKKIGGGVGGGAGEEQELDRDFYTKYQSGVLASRKPFAIDKGFFAPVVGFRGV